MTTALLVLLLGIAPGVFPEPAYAAEIDVVLLEPTALEAVFGEVDVEAEVIFPGEIAQVELLVDGRRVGSRTEPPWRFTVDVGQENVEHRFEVIAYDPLGAVGRSVVVTPRIKIDEAVDVGLQQLYVTASRSGERILDLEPEDFRIFDNDDPQDLVTFGRGDLPLAAVLLIDSSESMQGERFRAALEGARAFASGMRSLDEAMLMLFSDQLLHATAFTNDPGELLAPLGGLDAGGNTAINDHLFMALKLLEARQGRRVVVLMSDGADLHSVLSMADVLWKAHRSPALIYWIRLETGGGGSGFSTAWRDVEGNRRELEELERAVGASGGRIASISSTEEIEPAFREILSELRDQYVLGYYPSDERRDGTWHEIEVETSRSGLSIRTRGGYVDF